MFYALATDEENKSFLSSKVNLFIALAPVTRVKNMKAPLINVFMPFYDILDWFNTMVGWYELFGEKKWNVMFKIFCRTTPRLCYWSERLSYTNNVQADNFERTQVLIGHQPGGVSLKNLFHFAQGIRSEKFQLWDYDWDFATKNSNWEAYGQMKPPVVDLTQI